MYIINMAIVTKGYLIESVGWLSSPRASLTTDAIVTVSYGTISAWMMGYTNHDEYNHHITTSPWPYLNEGRDDHHHPQHQSSDPETEPYHVTGYKVDNTKHKTHGSWQIRDGTWGTWHGAVVEEWCRNMRVKIWDIKHTSTALDWG